MEAHVCKNGYIRKYPSIFCSMCMGIGAVEIEMSEGSIDEYNKKLREESERDGKEEK